MENFDTEKYLKERQFELENGINQARKEEIKKELKTMSSLEINTEIENLYSALTPILYDNNDFYCDILEGLLHSLLEGKYVVDISDKIDINLKNKFNKFFKQTELALEFSKKYSRDTIFSDSSNYFDLLFFDINKIQKNNENIFELNQKYQKILDTCKEIQTENDEYLQKYHELYLLAISLYINENDEYTQYIEQMDELNKKIDENNNKIPTKDELIHILKNNDI